MKCSVPRTRLSTEVLSIKLGTVFIYKLLTKDVVPNRLFQKDLLNSSDRGLEEFGKNSRKWSLRGMLGSRI